MQLFYLFFKRRFYFLLSFFLISFGNLSAQDEDFTDNKSNYQINIQKTSEAILLDGKLEEAVWQNAETAKDFWIKYPKVKPGANPKSEAMVTYNDKFIYVGIKCYGKIKCRSHCSTSTAIQSQELLLQYKLSVSMLSMLPKPL